MTKLCKYDQLSPFYDALSLTTVDYLIIIVKHLPLGGLGLGGTPFFGGSAGVSFFRQNGSSINSGWREKEKQKNDYF